MDANNAGGTGTSTAVDEPKIVEVEDAGGGGGGGGGGDGGGGDGGGDGDVGLKVGDRVNVVGLKSATHQQHNGSTGTVLGAQAAKGRYVVQLDAGKGEKPLDLALKPANCCKRL